MLLLSIHKGIEDLDKTVTNRIKCDKKWSLYHFSRSKLAHFDVIFAY